MLQLNLTVSGYPLFALFHSLDDFKANRLVTKINEKLVLSSTHDWAVSLEYKRKSINWTTRILSQATKSY